MFFIIDRQFSRKNVLNCLQKIFVGFLFVLFSFHLQADETPADKSTQTESQASEHFQAGTAAIKLKQWENAVTELEQATKLSPEQSTYHHALGIAYMGSKKPNAGWFHFRRAVRLDPQNAKATVDFMKTWHLLDAQGLFNVGVTIKKVAQTLGKPDQSNEQGQRLRLVYGFMSLNFINGQLFSILDLRSLPETGIRAVDGMAYSLPENQWIVAFRTLSATQGNTEYVKQGETVQSWTELFTSQRFINTAKHKSANDVMKGIQTQLDSRFNNVTFKVISQSEKDVLFAWSIDQSGKHAAQQEVVRIVQGKNDIHRLAYTRKGNKPEADVQDPFQEDSIKKWTALLKQAKLLPAEKLREYLGKQQLEKQKVHLRDISRQILKVQFKHIRNRDVASLKLFFAETVREKITPDLLKKTEPILNTLSPEKLIDTVEIKTEKGIMKANLIDNQGNVFMTLIQIKGRWFAETVWLDEIAK